MFAAHVFAWNAIAPKYVQCPTQNRFDVYAIPESGVVVPVGGKGIGTQKGAQSPHVDEPSVSTGSQDNAQNQLGNSEVQDRLKGGGMDASCPDFVLPSVVPANGELSYYQDRHDDFLNRYRFCGLTPPVYYLGYGHKYVERFTFETNDRLTPEGQAWLFRTRILLQKAIEDERASDPVAFDQLERNDAAFTRFAYDSHPDAYWDAGLGELSVFDLANIGLTPDARDLLGWDGLVQAADIGSRLGGVWGTDAIDYIYGEGTADMALEGMLIAYDNLGQEVDEVFGAGTAEILENTAIATGEDLVSIGQSLHGYASEAAETAIDASDKVFGEGNTEAAINNLSSTVSDGVDWVEERSKMAAQWADDLW